MTAARLIFTPVCFTRASRTCSRRALFPCRTSRSERRTYGQCSSLDYAVKTRKRTVRLPHLPAVATLLGIDPRGFPTCLPEFQQVFPDDAACIDYLEKLKWPTGFVCPRCGVFAEPYRFPKRPLVRKCRECHAHIGITSGTVMQSTHLPLSVWFWAAYLVVTQTPGQSAMQFQRQLNLSRHETAFMVLHKLRAGMVRPERDPSVASTPSRSTRRWSEVERAAKGAVSTTRSTCWRAWSPGGARPARTVRPRATWTTRTDGRSSARTTRGAFGPGREGPQGGDLRTLREGERTTRLSRAHGRLAGLRQAHVAWLPASRARDGCGPRSGG